MSRRHVADVEFDAAQVLLRIQGRVSELAEMLNGQSVNHVLWCGTVKLSPAGTFEQSFRVPFGAVSIANGSPAPITVVNGPLESTAPTQGRGVVVCGIGGDGTWTITGNVIAIYGPPGGQVVLEVMATAQQVIL